MSLAEARIQALASGLGAPYDPPYLKVVRGRFPVLIAVLADATRVSGVQYRVRTHPLPELELRRETDRDRAAKAAGVNVEVQTGDPWFDQPVYVESEAPEPAVRAALASRDARAAIVELLHAGVEVKLDEEGILAFRPGDCDLPSVLGTLERLQRIADPLPAFSSADLGRRPFPVFGVGFFGVVMSGAALSLPMAGRYVYPTVSDLAPTLLGLCVGACLFAPSAVFAFRKLRRRSTALRDLVVVLLVLAEWCFPGGLALVWLANGLADRSVPVPHPTTQYRCSDDEDSTTGTIHASWAPGVRFEVQLTSCDPFRQEGRVVVFSTRRGALGFEWVSRIE